MNARCTSSQQTLLPRRRPGQQGFLLIATYALLSVFLVYSNAMVVRTLTQGQTMEQFRARVQALDLAQGAAEQLREDVNYFLTNIVNAQLVSNNTIEALKWLDDFGQHTENPLFDVPRSDRNHDGIITIADGDGIPDGEPAFPDCVQGLPTITASGCSGEGAVQLPRAWVVSVCALKPDGQQVYETCRPPAEDPLAPRLMTIEAEARVGAITKRIRATYEIDLGMSNIFRYGYFLNNYGWIAPASGTSVWILGEVRSNGNLTFSGSGTSGVDGDLYASENNRIKDPVRDAYSQGLITGDPTQDRLMDIWNWKRWSSWYDRSMCLKVRPTRQMVIDGQPPVGLQPKTLPYGYGYDSSKPSPSSPDQTRYEHQPVQTMPYLGDLSLYRGLAQSFNAGAGSTLSYVDPKTGTPGEVTGTYSSATPLVLVGTASDPIRINGPVVVDGDVIIKGFVTGQGTIYAGRNIHVVGSVRYLDPPSWPAVERDQNTGQVRAYLQQGAVDVGSVCTDGTYVGPTGDPQSRCGGD